MKTWLRMSALTLLWLPACTTPPPQDSSSFYYASSNPTPGSTAASSRSSAAAAATKSQPVPRGGYAPSSGPTAMPQGNAFMYQQNVMTPFGSSSSGGVIRSSGGVQSYQTIGNTPIFPGTVMPGYVPNQPYYGTPGMPPPVYVPGVNGAPGYYLPATGSRR